MDRQSYRQPNNKSECCHHPAFCLTADVPRQKREGKSGLNLNADGHVEGEEETASVSLVVGYSEEKDGRDDVGKSPDAGGENGLVPLLGHVSSGQKNGDLESTLSETEQVGLENREAEVGLDNDVSVRTETSGGDRVEEVDREKAPSLRILESLVDMLHLELPVLNTGLVLTNTLDKLDTILLGNATSLHGRNGENVDDSATPENGQKTEDEEHDTPRSKCGMLNVVESKAEQSTEHGLKTVAAVPECDSPSLLFLPVPNGGESDESG